MHVHSFSVHGAAQRTRCSTQLARAARLPHRPWQHRRGLRCCTAAADSVFRTMSENGEVAVLVVDGTQLVQEVGRQAMCFSEPVLQVLNGCAACSLSTPRALSSARSSHT